MALTVKKIEAFLRAVDTSFPVPLSQKQELHEFALKLYEKGTLCFIEENGEICSMIAGYTDNVINDIGYISISATLPSARGKGYASKLIKEFISTAKEKKLKAIHLYAVRENLPAVKMYERLGFVEWNIENEPRPNDLHLIYYI